MQATILGIILFVVGTVNAVSAIEQYSWNFLNILISIHLMAISFWILAVKFKQWVLTH